MSAYSIAFSVPGVPVSKARARVLRSGRAYTPAPTIAYEKLVAASALLEMTDKHQELLKGPLAMMLAIYLPVPMSWSGLKRERALSGDLCPTAKPDIDNVIKSIADALNGVCYVDDSQIVDLIVSKRYSAYPRVDVAISCLGGDRV